MTAGPPATLPSSLQAQWAEELSAGLAELALSCDAVTCQKLLDYLRLLYKWNRSFNLTSVPAENAVSLHLLDSLAAAPGLHGDNIVDVGTGAGLPGIPLAVMFPRRNFTLLDSNQKKTRFLNQVVAQLGLGNVTVVHNRVQDYSPAHRFSCVISRAYSNLEDMLKTTRHLCDKEGIFLAMKGRDPQAELAELEPGLCLLECRRLLVPGLEAERHLVIIKNENTTA